MFHQINSNVHNNSINNSNHHNNNLFEEEYSHTQCTPRALWNIVECLCLYVCMFVCEFALLFGRIYSSKSLFFWSAPRLRDFSKKKSEWEPRENNIRPRKDRERVYFANRPRVSFSSPRFPAILRWRFEQTPNRERRERREDASKFFQTLSLLLFFFFFFFFFIIL